MESRACLLCLLPKWVTYHLKCSQIAPLGLVMSTLGYMQIYWGEKSSKQVSTDFLFSIFFYYFPLLFFTQEGFTIFLQLFGKMLMGQCNQIKYVNFLMNNHIGILLSSNKLGDFHKSYTMQWFFSLWLSTWRGFLLDITVYQ